MKYSFTEKVGIQQINEERITRYSLTAIQVEDPSSLDEPELIDLE